MTDLPPVRFAVVGCGHIGRRHADLIAAHPEAELAALCDVLPPEKLDYPLPEGVPFFLSLESLLQQAPDLDVVCICTPNGLHAAQALRVLEARLHVVVEKPMALHAADCEAIIYRALNVSRQVFCVMQNRYSPHAQWLKQIVQQGALGPLELVQLSCLWNRDERYYHLPDGRPHPWHGLPDLDGGVLYTQFAHFIDLLYWVFGDIHSIRTRLTNRRQLTPLADSGVVQFELLQGGLGSLQFSTAVFDSNFESSITVVGQRGSLRIGGQYMNELLHCRIQDVEPPDLPASAPPNAYTAGYQGSAANHHFVIQNVIDVLRGRQEATTNALEGMKVVNMIERIYSAAD